MFGIQSYRTLQGKRWLGAFRLIRGSKTPGKTWNVPQHSLLDTQCHPIPFQVHLTFASSGKTKEMPKLTLQTSKVIGNSSDGMSRAGDTELHDEESFFKDILLPSNLDYPGVSSMKSYLHQLDQCLVTLQDLRKSNSPISIEKILPKNFPRLVALSLNRRSPFALREKCLSLLLMNDVDSKLTVKLLTQTVEESHHLSVTMLMDVLQKVSASKPTEMRRKVRRDLVAHLLSKRCHEISQKHLVSVMYQLDELFDMKTLTHRMQTFEGIIETDTSQNSESFEDVTNSKTPADNLQDGCNNLFKRILDVVYELKTKDLVRILVLMAKWRHRNETLIAAVIHRLCLADLSDVRQVQLTNLLFACSSLNVYNETLLEQISGLLQYHAFESPSLITSALDCLSRLRWFNADFVSKCLTYSRENVSELTGREACSLLMSLANLYALPESDEDKNVITALGNQALSSNPSEVATVNVIWSLAILQCLTIGQVDAVLEPSFIKRFQDTKRVQNRSCLQKLHQIYTAAKLELSSHDGSDFIKDANISWDAHGPEEVSKSEQDLKVTLSQALNKFLPTSTHVGEGAELEGGYRTDAILCAEADGSLQPVSDLENIESSSRKLYRLAVKVIPFKGVIHPHKRLVGIYEMESRHLKALGCILVPILYSDLHKNKSHLEHVKAIQGQIQKCVMSAQ